MKAVKAKLKSDVAELPDIADRLQTANEAAWETEMLVLLLLREASAYQLLDPFLVRGLMLRVQQLASVVMSATSDAIDPLPEIRERLTGQRMSEAP